MAEDMNYESQVEADKKIIKWGTGYGLRITGEIAVMGLSEGDIVHIVLTKGQANDQGDHV